MRPAIGLLTVFGVGRRILLLITDLQIGGTPTVVRELATRLNRPPDVCVEVACLAGRGPVSDQLEAAGIVATALGARRASDLPAIARLVRLIRDRQFDTVFSFLLHANAAAALATRFCPGVRLIQSIQTTQPYPRWHWALQSLVQGAAEKIVAPSPSVATAAEEWAGIPRSKIAIIPNAIDPAEFTHGTGRESTEPSDANTSIGFIGRLDPIKCIPDLLEAVRLLRGKVRLHIFGDGSERSRIEAIVRETGLSDRVVLHGAIARPQDALSRIRLLVLPSRAEGFGLVLIEAMAAGVPVVATNVPGIRDVVRHDFTGLLVPPGSPADLARAIDAIVSSPALRRRLVESARREVRERFSWDVVLPRYHELLGLATLRPQPQDTHS